MTIPTSPAASSRRAVPTRLFALATVAALAILAAAPPSAVTASANPSPPASAAQERSPHAPQVFTSRLERGERAITPEDRYALAGGCYTLGSTASGADVERDGSGFAATAASSGAERFHLQATDLGRYLLFTSDETFLAADEGFAAQIRDAATDNSAAAIADGVTRGTVGEVADELATGPLGEASGRGGAVVAAERPSEVADWQVTEDGSGFRLTLPALDAALAVADDGELVLVAPGEVDVEGVFTFTLTDACAAWPEVEVNVEGAVVGGASPWSETRGYFDGHLHAMAFEFLGGRARCGQPWHPYGVDLALVGCPEHEDSGGRTNVLETGLSGTVNPAEGHDTQGWPTFTDWPAHDLLTYEQVYYRWLERSWRGGLRMFVNLLVDNYVLCEVYPFKVNSCNEMDGVRLQAERIRQLEAFIDAQHGGPGEGWLRIVNDPFEARRVINEGRLAVVLGIEVSRPFDCRLVQGVPQCDEDQIDEQLTEMYELGVRQMELVNKFDNALTGVKGDAGETGVIVNAGNVIETGGFWKMETCEDDGHGHDHGHGDAHDNNQHNIHDASGAPDELTGRDALAGQILQEAGRSGAAPIYPEAPHCNIMGLTELGEHTLERMMELGMIFDPDHMSARARHEAMDLIEAADYSGVISSHSWADDIIYQRVYGVGGVVTPMAGSSTRFVERWRQHREWADDRFLFGFGFGSDINGFATQGAPRHPDQGDALRYPFTGFGGVEVHQQVSGERIYDFNVDGVAHYGLYVDWVEDVRVVAGGEGDEIIADLERGPEAYLQMWERAIGIDPDGCRPDAPGLRWQQVDGLRQGMSAEDVVREIGQPHERLGHAFRYCLHDGGTAELRFDGDGQLVGAADFAAVAAPLPATGGGMPLAVLLLVLGAVSAVRSRTAR